ncbi:MAG: cytochrome c-type biogenesis protein CcmH [Calditrichaeota bacterium]|nr:cytochrome c-type biogenesis protein CcmH [Calditrichota bacterium]
MTTYPKIAILLLIATGLLWGTTTVSQVEKELMCTCGCTMALYTCECGRSEEMRAEIQQMINQGMDKEAIVASYVAKFGEKIRSAPTKSGFNLLAWVTPFLALLIVGVALYRLLQRWSRHQPEEPEPVLPPERQDQYVKQLEKELQEFEEGEIS